MSIMFLMVGEIDKVFMACEREEMNPKIRHGYCRMFSDCGGHIP